jgi:hypothetical protein
LHQKERAEDISAEEKGRFQQDLELFSQWFGQNWRRSMGVLESFEEGWLLYIGPSFV